MTIKKNKLKKYTQKKQKLRHKRGGGGIFSYLMKEPINNLETALENSRKQLDKIGETIPNYEQMMALRDAKEKLMNKFKEALNISKKFYLKLDQKIISNVDKIISEFSEKEMQYTQNLIREQNNLDEIGRKTNNMTAAEQLGLARENTENQKSLIPSPASLRVAARRILRTQNRAQPQNESYSKTIPEKLDEIDTKTKNMADAAAEQLRLAEEIAEDQKSLLPASLLTAARNFLRGEGLKKTKRRMRIKRRPIKKTRDIKKKLSKNKRKPKNRKTQQKK